jgi:uncharacterized protein YkwD
MMAWNLIDLVLLLVIALNVWSGWRRGFILGLLDLVRWVGSLLLGLRFYQSLAHLLSRFALPADWAGVWDQPIAFMLIVLFASLLLLVFERRILLLLPKDIHQRRANRVLGIVPGLVNGLIIAVILAPLLLALPLPDGLRDSTRESALANRLAIVSDRLEAALAPVFDEALKRTMNMRTIPPESERTLNLPFKVSDPKPRPDLEAKMLDLVNRERRAVGLNSLAADPELTEVARRHSIDMFARGYFSHLTLEGHTPFDRMRALNLRFLIAGENLAFAPTLPLAHTGLMNSPGHRANILRGAFGRVGIGIVDGGRRGLMVTQNFRN